MNRPLALLISLCFAAACLAGPLDQWLDQEKGQTVKVSEDEKITGGANPFAGRRPAGRPNAAPGVVELSNGKRIPGYIYTTRYQPLVVYVEAEKRWRRLPLPAVLSIEAVVVEQKLELRWRWKATGEPERVYTGKKYPTRRLLWKFKLIDGTEITGAVKGKPIWVEYRGVKSPPFVLHERSKGEDDQTLDDLVYIRRIVISKRVMDQVVKEVAQQGEENR